MDDHAVRRLGVIGGTFDPIHIGHLIAASEALSVFRLDRMLFVPAGRPWQKDRVSEPEHRFMMTTLAVAAHSAFAVSRMELDRRGPTYTVDTLRTLRDTYGEAELFFFMGGDTAAQLDTWHEIDRVAQLAHLVSVMRPGFDPSPEGSPVPLEVMQMPPIGVSATDIRERVRSGRPIDFLVPSPVATYIRENGLYVGGADA